MRPAPRRNQGLLGLTSRQPDLLRPTAQHRLYEVDSSMPQPITLAMPAIALGDPHAPAHLARVAEALHGFFTISAHEAAFLDGVLAEAMLDLEYGPETEREIYLAATAPGIAGYNGPAADAWRALRAERGAALEAEDICAFLYRHFGEHPDRTRQHCDETALKRDYADLGVSTGYIGNCERWGDNRTFMVFTRVKTPDKHVGFAAYRVMDVPEENRRFPAGQLRAYYSGPVPFNAPEVRAWLDGLRAKIAAGTAVAIPMPAFAE